MISRQFSAGNNSAQQNSWRLKSDPGLHVTFEEAHTSSQTSKYLGIFFIFEESIYFI